MIEKDTCSYEDKEKGIIINTCEDKVIITHCKICDRLYLVDQNTGDRRELISTLQELLIFLRFKDDEALNDFYGEEEI